MRHITCDDKNMDKDKLDRLKTFANKIDSLRAELNKAINDRDKLIRMLHAEGISVMELARIFNMKHQNVSVIIRRIVD